jgi:putative Mg2+ transporter-C (MgtC) family protein
MPFEPAGEGLRQLGELGAAFLLSALIGLEREIRRKSAGLRTYTLVGLASALLRLISKDGFGDVLVADKVVLDPSRVAAQIVSGIGFLGAGIIFVRTNAVTGLTTAATIWLTAAVGMACGAGLLLLATATTVGYFVVAIGFPPIVHGIKGAPRSDDDEAAPGPPSSAPGASRTSRGSPGTD